MIVLAMTDYWNILYFVGYLSVCGFVPPLSEGDFKCNSCF